MVASYCYEVFMLKLSQLDKKSLAYKSGLRQDDEIVAFDGEPALDMLDVAYYDSQEKFTVTVSRNGELKNIGIAKEDWQSMDWDFCEQCYIQPRWCANKCIFCFVDQLPKGQRKTLYVKDDDWRLSFATGNYVTLTNVSEREIQRILDKKFSPLYISVHATDDEVRRYLLGNANAQPIMPLLKRLTDGGIVLHTQVVMVPGVNDGKVLEQTVNDLYTLYPMVETLAIVPVGLTGHRQGLPELLKVDKEVADKTIDFVTDFAEKVYSRHGRHFVFCSDEMYVYAQRELPDYEYYDDFEQIENGVGLIADLLYQFNLALEDSVKAKAKSFTIVTGVSAGPYISQLIDLAKSKFKGVKVNVLTVVNKFFGSSVTVAGLLTGGDISEAVRSFKECNEVLLLPSVMLRETEDVFLDGMTLDRLKQETGKEIQMITDGYELCRAVLEK